MTDLATNPQGGDESVPTDDEAASSGQEGDTSQNVSLDAENQDGDGNGDDTAEIEHEGQTYRVPKALKGAYLMHADYTRKTQDVAEKRRAVAERDASLRQHTQVHAEHMHDISRVLACDDALAQYEQVNWDGLRAQNPAHAQTLWSRYINLKNQRDATANLLQANVINRQQASEAETARRYAECQAILSREIKEWSPELSSKLKEFGIREFGFTPYEVGSVTDPRIIKVLHRAMMGDQMMKKAAAAARAAEQEGVKPLPQVGNSASATRWDPRAKASDKASTAEWMKRRTDQVRTGK